MRRSEITDEMEEKLTITGEQAEEAVYAIGIQPDDVLHLHYSSRHRDGEQCIGLVGTFGQVFRFLCSLEEIGALDWADIERLADETCQDSMGIGTIHYWPSLEVVEEEPARS